MLHLLCWSHTPLENKHTGTRVCVCVWVSLLCWGSAAGREEPAGSAPTGGCRPGLSAGVQTTAQHLFDQTAQQWRKRLSDVMSRAYSKNNKCTQMYVHELKRKLQLQYQILIQTDIINRQVSGYLLLHWVVINNIKEKQDFCLSWKVQLITDLSIFVCLSGVQLPVFPFV